MDDGSMAGLEAGESVVAQTELRQLQGQVRELERLLGRETLENEILRDAVRIAREETDLAVVLVEEGHAVKPVSEALCLARSNLRACASLRVLRKVSHPYVAATPLPSHRARNRARDTRRRLRIDGSATRTLCRSKPWTTM
jgi:hypothetical protein